MLYATTAQKEFADIAIGSPDYPDRATTLILHVDTIVASPLSDHRNADENPSNQANSLTLTGPGILDAMRLEIQGIDQSFWQWRNMLCQDFPCGVDIIFTHQGRFVALPRSTKVEY